MRFRFLYIILGITLIGALVNLCSSDSDTESAENTEIIIGHIDPILASLLSDRPDNDNWQQPGLTPPDEGCQRLRIRPFGGSLGRVFNDRNDIHLAHAKAGGIKPLTDIASAWKASEGLMEVRSCRYYWVDSLVHSYPYLTPEALDLLNEICINFHDSLEVRGGGAYRPKVTSLLRTPQTVKQLRRVNRNATSASAHQFGTTFDLSYSKFICDDPNQTHRTFEDLKNLLGEVVADLRRGGRCVVKHERRQACFHITVCANDNVTVTSEESSDDDED